MEDGMLTKRVALTKNFLQTVVAESNMRTNWTVVLKRPSEPQMLSWQLKLPTSGAM
jgi:hypothetical protein